MAGLGAGLITDAVIHLICGAADLAHTVPWHFGGVALMVSTGAFLGKVLPKW
ncbi:NrsF family protein [Thermodesulfobacteriota bacterium]